MPEDIKTTESITEADIRRRIIVIVNQRTGTQRPFTFSDLEARVADIVIPDAAPEEVRDLLTTSKNLLLYSWFYFPFSMTASLQAAVALERALKIRLNGKRRDTLTYLLKRAIRERVLTDEGFPRWRSHQEAFRLLHAPESIPRRRSLVCLLLKTFPHFRNTLAHGDRFVDDIGFLHLDIVNEAVTQLFSQKEKDIQTASSPI